MLSGALWIAAGVGIVVWVLLWWRHEQPRVERSGTAFVPVPPTECYAEIDRVLAAWPDTRSVVYHPHDDVVEIRTHGSMGGFGEHLAVRATKAHGGSLVVVSSSPAFWGIVVDYGRNRRNVRAVLDGLLARCGGTLVEPVTDAD
jgi:hypothetical protein